MFDDTYFTIRWRWVAIGLTTICLGGLIIFGVHEWQVSRIAEAVLTSARTHADSGDIGAAKKNYKAYLGLVTKDVEAREEYARLILSEQRTVENDLTVMELLDDAMRHGSTETQTRIELIRAAVRLERFSTAAAMISSLDLKAMRNAELYAIQGLCCARKGNSTEAKRAFQDALDLDSTCAQAWEGLVELTEEKEGLSAALNLAEEMTAKVGGPEPHSIKAHLLTKTDNPTRAGKAFWDASREAGQNLEKATEFADFIMYNVSPTSETDLTMVRAAYDALSASAESIDYMTAARLGDLAHRLKLTDEAVAHYQRCLEIKPGDAFAIGRTTEVFAAAGQLDKAHRTLDSMASFQSLALLQSTLRAGLFAEAGRFRDASDLLEEVVSSSGDPRLCEGAHFLLVECLWEQRDFNKAVEVAAHLVEQSTAKDKARNLLVDALIRSGDYEEVVKQLQLFRNPASHLDRNLTMLIETAGVENQMARLRKYIDKHEALFLSSPLTVIFEGYQMADEGKTSAAVTMLAKAAAENADTPEYWVATEAVRDRFTKRAFASNGVKELCDISDKVDRVSYASEMFSRDPKKAGLLVRRFFESNPDSLEPLKLTAAIVDTTNADQATRQEFLRDLHDRISVTLRQHGATAVPMITRLFTDIGHEEQAFQLLANAVARIDSRPVLQAFCNCLGTATEDSVFGHQRIRSDLLSGDLKCTDMAREVLLAESDALNLDLESAIMRLSNLLDGKSRPLNEAVAASLLRLSSYDDASRAGLADIGFQLLKNNPDDPNAIFALSCGLRASRRYSESVRYAVEAFSKKQDPAFLLHAAYTEWRADRIEAARELLKLAIRAGLRESQLHVLDRELLRRLQTDPEIQWSPAAQDSHISVVPSIFNRR